MPNWGNQCRWSFVASQGHRWQEIGHILRSRQRVLLHFFAASSLLSNFAKHTKRFHVLLLAVQLQYAMKCRKSNFQKVNKIENIHDWLELLIPAGCVTAIARWHAATRAHLIWRLFIFLNQLNLVAYKRFSTGGCFPESNSIRHAYYLSIMKNNKGFVAIIHKRDQFSRVVTHLAVHDR